MAQMIKQANIFGRIGTGIGKGLGESIPKEIERSRLSSGLKELGEKKNLTPFQQFAELSGIPGITPQAIQSGTELLKMQGQRQGYANRAGQQAPQQGQQNALSGVDFANLNQRSQPSQGMQQQEQTPQGNFPEGEPQIVEKNPLSKELQPAIPWTPQERDSEIARVWDQNPQLSFPEVSNIVADNERRYLESPEAYRAQQENLENVQSKVNDEIESQLRRKLHVPKDKEVWDKLTGESHNRIERGVSRDLKKNPQANVKDIVNTWTDRALDNEKAKSELVKLKSRPFDEKVSPSKKADTLDKLISIGKTHSDFGNSEEYYNSLQSDFDLSPEGAASIAYPLSKTAGSFINKIKPSNFENFNENTKKYANQIGDYLTRNDSILSIAKNIKQKDPAFDIREFVKEVRSIQDELGLSPTQKRELETRGVEDIFPNWGDIFLFPNLGKGFK